MPIAAPARQAMGWLALSIFGWGSTYVAIEIALRSATPGIVAAARPLAGALFILVPLSWSRHRLGRGLWGWVVMLGFLNTTLVTVGAVVGTASVGPGLSAVLVNTAPFFMVFLATVVLREPVAPQVVLAVVTGFIGVLLIVFRASTPQIASATSTRGLVLLLLGSFGFACASIIVRVILNKYQDVDLFVLTGWQLFFGGLLCLPYAALAPGKTSWGDAELWASFLYLGLTAAGMWGWFRAVEIMGAARAGSFMFLVPVVAVMIEIVRGNLPSPREGLGILVVLVAIRLVTRRKEAAKTMARVVE